MLKILAIKNYRSILDLKVNLSRLNLITGPNGSGKSNLYRALRLLADTAEGGVITSLAAEGGLESTFWAGPEFLSNAMKLGQVEIQGGRRQHRKLLQLGFASDNYSYAISLGLTANQYSAFGLDPEIKREYIWKGDCYRPSNNLVDRKANVVKIRLKRKWEIFSQDINTFDSLFDQFANTSLAPEIFDTREMIRSWRFYDHFRTDKDSPIRRPQLGTRTPVLHHDGHDLAAALQTIIEIGDHVALDEAIKDAFGDVKLKVTKQDNGLFSLAFHQKGLLRPLTAAELSDGTLRYILWIAALLTPRPPSMMVLNEPETSIHNELLPSLAKLISNVTKHSQVLVISHSNRLIKSLNEQSNCHAIELEKELGSTQIKGMGILDEPAWHWNNQ